jgi:hypothetical protein
MFAVRADSRNVVRVVIEALKNFPDGEPVKAIGALAFGPVGEAVARAGDLQQLYP